MKGKISITLDDRLIEKIDRERGRVPRSAAIEELIVNAYSRCGPNAASPQ